MTETVGITYAWGPEDLSGERTNFLRSKRSLLVDKLHLAYLGDFLVLGRLPDE